jgi:hypothetical protein
VHVENSFLSDAVRTTITDRPRTDPYERAKRIRLPPWRRARHAAARHTAQIRGTRVSRSVSGRCWAERCSPWPSPLSPDSAEDHFSLFIWFIDAMAQSDSSEACASALWLWAFANRPRSVTGRGAPEVSRFVHVVSRRALVLRLRRTDCMLANRRKQSYCLPPSGKSRRPDFPLSKLNSPAHRYPCLRFERHLAMPPARQLTPTPDGSCAADTAALLRPTIWTVGWRCGPETCRNPQLRAALRVGLEFAKD